MCVTISRGKPKANFETLLLDPNRTR